ncbi:Annexin_2 [Hexamita inflata]|uniref:Annexin 2 n=1 Tax=Hexamita inflata TaxID=28002 RepID=A0AA86NYW5_9EUKA|nr:Annexin 2 [Hexamita inflata]
MMKYTSADYYNFASEIYLACKGIGTNEQRILNVITKCTVEDLFQVNRTYYASYGMSLIRLLENQTSGNFQKLICGSFEGRYQYWARKIREAVKGRGTDERVLIELILMANAEDMAAISEEYFRMTQMDILDDISDDIARKADWAKLLRGWISQTRYARGTQQQDADALYTAAKGSGTDENVFIRILCSSTKEEFSQICDIYANKHKKTLRQTIAKEFFGKSEKAFLLAHDSLLSSVNGCCYIIRDAIKGIGTRDRSLINVSVLFRDRHNQLIHEVYTQYGSLAKDIKGDTSGWYKKTLLQMWKAQ